MKPKRKPVKVVATMLIEECTPWPATDPPRPQVFCDPRGGQILQRASLRCPRCGGKITQRLGVITDVAA